MDGENVVPPAAPGTWPERQWARVERTSKRLTTVKNLVTAIGVIGGVVISLGAVAGKVYPAAQAQLFALFEIQQRSWEDITQTTGNFDPSCAHRMIYRDDAELTGPGGIKLVNTARIEPLIVQPSSLFTPWNPENRIAISAGSKNILRYNDIERQGGVERRC